MRIARFGIPLIGFALASCQAASPDGDEAPPDPSPADERASSVHHSLSLRLILPDTTRHAQPISMTLRVENTSDRPVDLYLTGRPVAFDLIVTDARDDVVWRRLEDAVIPAILQVRTLAPGETLELEDSWDQRSNAGELVPPGDYSVRGELLAEEAPLATPKGTLHIVEL